MGYDEVQQAASWLQSRTQKRPTAAVILGSGLGSVVDAMEDKEVFAYADIPGFPKTQLKGHAGRLILGRIGGQTVAAMQGRFHYYEGLGMQAVTFPIYVLRALGVERLIVTNACGGINRDFVPGDLMLITDHLNLTGLNPLIGENDDRLGPRFPDMTEAYSRRLLALAEQTAGELGLECRRGVYAFFTGPCFETAAEIRALAVLGADAVGMSTVPEVVVANYLGMEVLGVACITNMATGIAPEKHSHEAVLEIANRSAARLAELLCRLLAK